MKTARPQEMQACAPVTSKEQKTSKPMLVYLHWGKVMTHHSHTKLPQHEYFPNAFGLLSLDRLKIRKKSACPRPQNACQPNQKRRNFDIWQ